MDFALPDFIGIVGVFLVLLAYFLLQHGRVSFDAYLYLGLNALGACLILYSLIFKFNPASVLIECCWLGISLYGFIRKWRLSKQDQEI